MAKQKKSKAQKTYEYYMRKLQKEAKRGGLTTQEEKLLKLVDKKPSEMSKQELGKKASKLKAEFKRVRTTKKYKAERKLRNEFYKELGKYRDYELRREARERLLNLPPRADQLQDAYFKVVRLDKLMREGITRRVDNKLVKYRGVEAVKKQIESLQMANNPERKKRLFINTYIEQLLVNGLPTNYDFYGEIRHPIDEMRTFLESCSPQQITFLLDTGYLPDIAFYYTWTDDDTETFIKRLDLLNGDRWKWEAEFDYVKQNEDAMVKILKKEKRLKQKQKDAVVHNNYES